MRTLYQCNCISRVRVRVCVCMLMSVSRCEWILKKYLLTVAHTRMACTERIKSAFESRFSEVPQRVHQNKI